MDEFCTLCATYHKAALDEMTLFGTAPRGNGSRLTAATLDAAVVSMQTGVALRPIDVERRRFEEWNAEPFLS